MPNKQKVKFKNSFISWYETFYEIVAHLTITRNRKRSMSYLVGESGGTFSLYELAKELADKWEDEHVGWDWDDNDFWLTIEQWLKDMDKNPKLRPVWAQS